MRFATSNKLAACCTAGFLATGCAAPAPDLPRYVKQDIGASETNSAVKVDLTSRITLTTAAFTSLSADEQEKLRAMSGVQFLDDERYGIIIDAQSVDQSTPGTNSGAALGGALASAGYVDRALRGGNYSVVNQLALGLAGAAIGSSLDSSSTARFQFRYAVKLGDGDIKYFDETKSTAFRHAVGVCVLTPSLELVSQRICNQSAETIRRTYLKTKN